MAQDAMIAAQALRLALFVLSAFMAGYGFNDRRFVLGVYWLGVAVYWLINFIIS